ncbi:MAG: hypothetical protein P1P63_04740 [Treponemataceae bacterium]
MSEIKDFEIAKRLALIADLAEDAQAGIEEMLVPFLLYGLAVPAETGLSWYLGYIGQGKFIWVLWFVLMAICPLCLNFYYRRISKTKIKRASDTLFSVLWGSITGGIVLSFVLVILEKLTFTAVFFIIALLLAIGCITSGAIIQKKGRQVLFVIAGGWVFSAVACLFVSDSFIAPLIIGIAAFFLFAVPAAIVLLHNRKKKRV